MFGNNLPQKKGLGTGGVLTLVIAINLLVLPSFVIAHGGMLFIALLSYMTVFLAGAIFRDVFGVVFHKAADRSRGRKITKEFEDFAAAVERMHVRTREYEEVAESIKDDGKSYVSYFDVGVVETDVPADAPMFTNAKFAEEE